MKRLVMILLVGAIGLGTTAAVGLSRSGGVQSSAAIQGTPAASLVINSQGSEAPQNHSLSSEWASEDLGQPAEAPATAACDPEAMLPVIAEAIDPRSDLGRVWDSVDIKECQNGYARVFAVTGGPPPPQGTQLEGGEQVFLQDAGGEWRLLSSGSGLDCYPGSMPPDLKDACEALGLP